MAEPIAESVIAVLAQQAGRRAEELPREARLAELGLDSMALVEAIFALEERFDISLPFNANTPDDAGLDSVGDVVALVEKLVRAG